MTDGSDPELGLLYYLFSAHNWGLADLRALWEGETGWHDLILALSSYEANQRAEARKGVPPKKAQKINRLPTGKRFRRTSKPEKQGTLHQELRYKAVSL